MVYCNFLTLNATLQAEPTVLAFAGSLRKDSCNKKLINQAASIARELGAQVIQIDLKDFPIPLYDGDLEEAEGMPENAKYIRQLMINSQVIFIASPDYNHSVSAVLKNVLDWTSRSENAERSREAFQGKKFAIMSASPSKSGGAKGLSHLRDILLDQKAIVLERQISIPYAYEAFDEQGGLKDLNLKSDLYLLIEEALKTE
ncbi:MAG: NAD(P)H-dependent oxidoreductase [Parachlamydiaceae bacterium]|nr:MAG: NAD(P)H-dependent oxidoreductase [Parachlamydiaceae bacterium]